MTKGVIKTSKCQMKETREYVHTAPAVVPRVKTAITAVKSVKKHSLTPTVVVGIPNVERKREARTEYIMRKRYRTLLSIEYAFVTAIIAAFSVVGIAGFIFGFQLGRWTEWQGVLVGSVATIAAVIGAALGLRISFAHRMKLRHRLNHKSH